MAKNSIGHVEWRTRDTARLKSFYGSLFKWKFDEAMPGVYTSVRTGNDAVGGGILQLGAGDQMPTGISNYINVDDLDAQEEKIKALGGQILISKREVPGEGRFSVFTDPDSNIMAVWQPISAKDKRAAEKLAKKSAKAEKKAAKDAAKAQKKAAKAQKSTAAPTEKAANKKDKAPKDKDKDKKKKKKNKSASSAPSA
jgi:predicted enzyme related to lactoylglutathione lyase